MIYLDACATTKPAHEVLKTYQRVNEEFWYNANSPHKLGNLAQALVAQAEKSVLNSLGLDHDKFCVFFTKGGTEANNNAIFGLCNAETANKRIITTKIEHPSVSACFSDLKKKGYETIFLDVDENGLIDVEQFEKVLTKTTTLVSIHWVNNILGAIQPLKKVIEILKKYPRVKLHVDAVQGIGKVAPDFDLASIDFLTISAHKINGLKGAGLLIAKRGIRLDFPLKSANENPGTIDVAGAMACAKALQLAMENQLAHLGKINNLFAFMKEGFLHNRNFIINGGTICFSPYILNVSLRNHQAETVMHFLEQHDIYVSTGSACSSKLKKPEPTILAISGDEKRALSSIRFGFSYENEIEQLKKTLSVLNLFCPNE